VRGPLRYVNRGKNRKKTWSGEEREGRGKGKYLKKREHPDWGQESKSWGGVAGGFLGQTRGGPVEERTPAIGMTKEHLQ